ncbi:MAG: D-aminoacyl-tRNA deacylase [Candidatus Micrarchaeia archaeon]
MEIRIVYSMRDPAALNIAECLEGIGFSRYKTEGFEGEGIRFSPENKGYAYIMLSRHKSEKGVRAITCHHTGNWTGEALYGGMPRDVCISVPGIERGIAEEVMKRVASVNGYEFTLEVTHHGPTGDFPLLFVEIGSCEQDWRNKDAGMAIAEALNEFEVSGEGEVVMGVGGPHYAPNFTKLIKRYRIGHIIPKYAIDGLEYETFVKGIEKSVEKTEKVLVDWKGLDAGQRSKITKFCGMYGIDFIKYK